MYVEVLVGAVGIENNTARNFKSLRGIRKNAKSLKRNDEVCKGILISSLKAPSIFFRLRSSQCGFLDYCYELYVGFGPKFCGADGKPTKSSPDLWRNLSVAM